MFPALDIKGDIQPKMSNIADAIYNMHYIDEVAGAGSPIHRIHPLAKLLVTIVYLFIVVSFSKYDIIAMLPLVFYPVIMLSLGDIPVRLLSKPMLIAAPLVLGIGIFNPIMDPSPLMIVGSVTVTGGWISFLSLVFKCILTVTAAIILVASTGMEKVALSLRILHVPRLFVLQLLLTYRYIYVLMEEAGRVWNAYILRAPGQKGIHFRVWGPLAGQMLLRTMDRAQRVYEAMKLRGFEGEYHPGGVQKFSGGDVAFALGWILFLVMVRYYNLPALIGQLGARGLS